MSDTPTLRIEIVSGQPSDSEQALISAAVLTLLQTRQPAPDPAPGLSAWQRAARQEAVGGRHGHSDAAWLPPAEAPWPS